jgi:hypothetical protein
LGLKGHRGRWTKNHITEKEGITVTTTWNFLRLLLEGKGCRFIGYVGACSISIHSRPARCGPEAWGFCRILTGITSQNNGNSFTIRYWNSKKIDTLPVKYPKFYET